MAAKAKPTLLEPVVEVEVTTPDEYVGDIMGDLNGRSAKVQGMQPAGGKTVIKAYVAEAELYKYASALRSITQGRAHHTRSVPRIRRGASVEGVEDHRGEGGGRRLGLRRGTERRTGIRHRVGQHVAVGPEGITKVVAVILAMPTEGDPPTS